MLQHFRVPLICFTEAEQDVLQHSIVVTPQVVSQAGERRPRCCRTCKKPMKGHPRGRCESDTNTQ